MRVATVCKFQNPLAVPSAFLRSNQADFPDRDLWINEISFVQPCHDVYLRVGPRKAAW